MRRCAWLAVGCAIACGSETTPPAEDRLPSALPIEITREDTGAPITDAERADLTRRVAGFFDEVPYWDWLSSISHGMDASTGRPDYLLFWQDIEAVKTGELVTFRHPSEGGGAHNIYIPTPKILAQAASTYLLTEDPTVAKLVEGYAKGLAAACKGMVFDESDPNVFLMARNFVAQDHAYTLDDGRQKAVEYSGWYSAYERWNAQRIHFPNNPYWGDIWVTNMRSKDDVPHIYSAVPYLYYLIQDAPDSAVRDAAIDARDCIEGFAKDIVDSGYLIRTKDESGQPFVPDQDLASFVQYESLIENGECTAKLTSAFLAYDAPRDNDCGLAFPSAYEDFAVAAHYYNYAIVRNFHLAAIWLSLLSDESDTASRLLRGLILRVEDYDNLAESEPGRSEDRWDGELAVFKLRAASVGLPLTSDDVRQIHAAYSAAIEAYEAWDQWNLWDPSVPDGTYPRNGGIRPNKDGHFVGVEEMGLFHQYCFSPFKNPAGVPPIDCAALTR